MKNIHILGVVVLILVFLFLTGNLSFSPIELSATVVFLAVFIIAAKLFSKMLARKNSWKNSHLRISTKINWGTTPQDIKKAPQIDSEGLFFRCLLFNSSDQIIKCVSVRIMKKGIKGTVSRDFHYCSLGNVPSDHSHNEGTSQVMKPKSLHPCFPTGITPAFLDILDSVSVRGSEHKVSPSG